MSSQLIAVLVSFAAALVLTPLSMAVARRAGALDRPGPLKPQHGAVPVLGGAAVFLATAPWIVRDDATLLVPLAAALVLGTVDDLVQLAPWHRLAGQLAIGSGIAAIVPLRLTQPVGGLLVVGAAVLIVNGVNLIDGLDGLASGVTLACCGGFAVLMTGSPRLLALAGVGALAGFLAYNRPPARVYLGDGGSTFLGALAVTLLASAWSSGPRLSTSVAALLLVAVPVAEVAVAVVRRLRSSGHVLAGDRRHPYDLLVERGWRPSASALAYVGAAAILAAAASAVAALHSLGGAVAAGVAAAGILLGAAGACGALHGERRVST